METSEGRVAVIDAHGNVLCYKSRENLDKKSDIYPVVMILLRVKSGEICLVDIGKGDGNRIYQGKLGISSCGIKRVTEKPEEAAKRSISKDFIVHNLSLKFLGSSLVCWEEGVFRYVFAYSGRVDYVMTKSTNTDQLVFISPDKLKTDIQINPNFFSPSFLSFIRAYQDY